MTIDIVIFSAIGLSIAYLIAFFYRFRDDDQYIKKRDETIRFIFKNNNGGKR